MKNVFKDDRFQGFNKKDKYFEGWYFKAVSKDQKQSLALIPGVSLAKDDQHAFIQVFVYVNEGQSSVSNHYFRFDIKDFVAKKDKFFVKIKENTFSLEGVNIHLEDLDTSIKGQYTITNPVKLPKSLFQPSIMGPFAYLPKMECYHGILSVDHDVKGQMLYNDRLLDFNNGSGYVEKDYGKSFPKGYVWIQTNNFDEKHTSLFVSVAAIPYLGLTFNGFIVNFYYNHKHFRFATYNFSKIKVEIVDAKSVHYVFKKGKYQLEVTAVIEDFVMLASPKFGKMDHTIKEGLSGKVTVKLTKKGETLYRGDASSAGIEIMKPPTLKTR